MRNLMAILALVTVAHATPSDGSFSAAGAAAWDGTSAHTVQAVVTGQAIVAETGAYGDLIGAPTFAAVATSGAYTDLSGLPVLVEASAAWPIGSIYHSTRSTTPTTILGFGVWAALEGQFLAGVKAADPEFAAGASGGATGVSSQGVIDMTLYIPKGANSATTFTASGTIAWPASVPQFTGGAVTASASVNWPTGVPTYAGTSHQHGLPVSFNGATVTAYYLPASGSAWGMGTVANMTRKILPIGATGTNINTVASALAVMLSQPASSAGVVSWPASVAQAVVSLTAVGIVSWPTGAPAFNGVEGAVPAQTFAGTAGSGTAVFAGSAASVLPPYRTVYIWERTA